MNLRKPHLCKLFPPLMALWLAPAAFAGPPLICHSFSLGGAASLPWDSGTAPRNWNAPLANYDLKHLVSDTLQFLTPQTPVIVRMETLRRATLYAVKDPVAAKELLGRLRARADEAEAGGHPQALAEFDCGYLAESYKQANWMFKQLPSGKWETLEKPNPAMNTDGYARVEKAIGLSGNAEMEFAAALISMNGNRSEYTVHVQKALAGAKTDPLLASNLRDHFFGQQGETLSEVLEKTGGPKN